MISQISKIILLVTYISTKFCEKWLNQKSEYGICYLLFSKKFYSNLHISFKKIFIVVEFKKKNIIVKKILKQIFQYLYKNFFIKYILEKISYYENIT